MDGKAVCLSLVREFLYRKNLLGVLSKFDDETGTVGGAPLSSLELIRTLNLASVHQRNVTHGEGTHAPAAARHGTRRFWTGRRAPSALQQRMNASLPFSEFPAQDPLSRPSWSS